MKNKVVVMKYQNILLTVIASCLIIITLTLTGVIQPPPKTANIEEPVNVTIVGVNRMSRNFMPLPVEIDN